MAPLVAIFPKVCNHGFLAGQSFMRDLKSRLQLPDKPIIRVVFSGFSLGFLLFSGNGYWVNSVQLRRVDLPPVSSFAADMRRLFMAFEIVPFDFPVAFAASPRVYIMEFLLFRLLRW